MNKKNNLNELKECFLLLDNIVPTIDKIGSGFTDTEEVALALLCYFKNEDILSKLSKIRKIIDRDIESKMDENDYYEFIEQEINSYKIPYNKTKKELLKMITDNSNGTD